MRFWAVEVRQSFKLLIARKEDKLKKKERMMKLLLPSLLLLVIAVGSSRAHAEEQVMILRVTEF